MRIRDDTPGALDLYLREQHIGLGCALENLMLAAAANGYNATATLLPVKQGIVPHPLYHCPRLPLFIFFLIRLLAQQKIGSQ